jgi:hypothetical protein
LAFFTKRSAAGVVAIAAAVVTACSSDVTSPAAVSSTSQPLSQITGNGAPNGSHYELNIIGVAKGKTADMTGTDGHSLFVWLDGTSKINLIQGPDFSVLDRNGTDANGAAFQLPNPGLAFDWGTLLLTDADTEYSVYIRALGKPGGWATMTTCAEIAAAFSLDGKTLKGNPSLTTPGAECSLEQIGTDILTSRTGSKKFTNVTAQLLTIVLNVIDDATGAVITTVRVPIFNEAFENEFWEYDNHGLKLAQVRFYPCSTNVITGVADC